MENRPFTYMTFHRVRFSSPISAHETTISGPKRALEWVFGTDSTLTDYGLRTRVSDVWGGAAFYGDPSETREAFTNVLTELSFAHEVVDAWHALICPISHKGETNWFGSLDHASNFVPSKSDPGGPLLVLTSAGYDALTGDALKADLPRRY